jgi:hypothetical protein
VPKATPTYLPQEPVKPSNRSALLISAKAFQDLADAQSSRAAPYYTQATEYANQAYGYADQADGYANQANWQKYDYCIEQYNKYKRLSDNAMTQGERYSSQVSYYQEQADNYKRMAQSEK